MASLISDAVHRPAAVVVVVAAAAASGYQNPPHFVPKH